MNEPKLDLTCPYSFSTSIYKMLEHEKFVNRFKLIVSLGGVLLTIVVAVIAVYCYDGEVPEVTIEGAFSALLTIVAVEEATDSKIDLLEALQSKINEIPEERLKKKYLDMLFKILKTQSFPNETV